METQSRKKRSTLLKLSLLIGLPLCLLILTLMALSIPDQIRTLPASDGSFESKAQGEVTKQIKQWAAQPDKKEAQSALREIARKNNPLPNISGWTAEQQAEARRYHAEVCEVVVDYLTLVERTRDLSLDEAIKQLGKLGEKMRSIHHKYDSFLGHCSKSERVAMYKQRQTLRCSTLDGIYVDRGLWIDAAKANFGDWDRQVYYLRQGGIEGRAVLVLWSVKRRIWPDDFQMVALK